MDHLFRNLLWFGRLLRASGLEVAPGAMLEAARALSLVGLARRRDVQYTLRTLLVRRHEELEAFDTAFEVFFRPRPEARSSTTLTTLGAARRLVRHLRATAGPEETTVDAGPPAEDGTEGPGAAEAARYSREETLRSKDFAALGPGELDEAVDLLRRMRWQPAARRTRRWRPSRAGRLDLRRTVARSLRHGGELVELLHASRVEQPRPLVILCDVSGSMERYSRMLLHFVHAMSAHRRHVESFVFATRLARLTPEACRGSIDALLAALPRLAPDFGGGTRIGEAIAAFNLTWARRVMRRGPVVLLVSDGWDRGDPALLSAEIARLQRTCHRLIWLNPLLGAPTYQPLTRGMRAALSWVDDFLPVHNLRSLDALAAHLDSLPARRPGRRSSFPPVPPLP